MSTPIISLKDVAAADDLHLKLRLDQDRRTWMLSSTFWQQQFKINRRTAPRIAAICRLLDERHLVVSCDGEFGSERLDTKLWIKLSDVGPYPTDVWFDTMRCTRLKTETDVKSWFVLPLLAMLDYTPGDIVTEKTIPIVYGTNQETSIRADYVIKNPATQRPLLVVEAKSTTDDLTKCEGQARNYAYWLHTPAWVLTNGKETRLYHDGVGSPPSIALSFAREDIKSAWPAIITHLSRESIHHFAGQFWHPLDGEAGRFHECAK